MQLKPKVYSMKSIFKIIFKLSIPIDYLLNYLKFFYRETPVVHSLSWKTDNGPFWEPHRGPTADAAPPSPELTPRFQPSEPGSTQSSLKMIK